MRSSNVAFHDPIPTLTIEQKQWELKRYKLVRYWERWCAWEADAVNLKKHSPGQVGWACKRKIGRVYTHVHTHRAGHCEWRLVCLFSQSSPSSRCDPSTGFLTHSDPWGLEGMLAPWLGCTSRTGVLLHRLEFWKKKKGKNWGISLSWKSS